MDKIGRRALVILCAFSLTMACGDSDDGGSDDNGDGGSTTSDTGGSGTTGDGGGSGTGSDGGGSATDGGTDDGGTGTGTGTGDGGTGTGTGTGGNDCPSEAEDGECVACIKANCCEGYQICVEDEDCTCVLECLEGGGAGTGTGTGTGTGGVNCPALCNGGGAWSSMQYCVMGMCPDECPL